MSITMKGFTTLVICFSLLYITTMSEAVDTLSASQSITGNQTIISADESFELGFFSPQSSENRYLGIWYKKIRPITVVWVANRETSLPGSTGTLKVNNQGVLVVLNHNETTIWSSNWSGSVQNPIAQLLNTGNLVVKEANDDDPENFLWQSFDYPCDTFLPVFKLGRIRATGFDRILTSWKSPEDPSPGSYTYRVEPHGYPQLVLSEGSTIKYRTGPWNGLRYSGTPNLRENRIYKFGFVLNDKEMYYSYELLNSSVLSRMILSSAGVIERYIWIDRTQGWSLYLTAPIDNCDAYALCGSHGSCNVDNSPVCQCTRGFVPKSQEEWDRVDWSNGCVRRTPLNCSDDVFLKYTGLKLPDTQWSQFNTTMNLDECEIVCKKSCNCTAYTNLDIREGGSGCLMWFGDLIDIREYNEHGQDLYIRMAASEAGKLVPKHNQKKQVAIIVSSVVGALILALVLIVYILSKKKRLNREVVKGYNSEGGNSITESQKKDLELPLFDYPTIATATNYFSENNKLGEGGFGPVYKGTLKEGQEIAVKKLSRNSDQGMTEFKNEVKFIAKLQHRNLVKLLGCCIEEEKILLYEYMPNKSLDFFIFDQTQRKLLNWQKCFDIINGIGRGLLYLHQDSRLRIIHRDLKARNILLDYEMNPKISDFGLARSFGGNETEANTKRVVGTYGYMSPEYAIDGIFSVKSDVYSYGVLMLEIVSGKRNRGFNHPDHLLNLVGHAWKLFYEDRSLELIDDSSMGDSCNLWEVSRSIHVGLLCVQRNPEDRPSMASVVLMLSSDITLPKPKEPGFFTQRDIFEADTSSSNQASSSGNKMSITMLSGR